MTYRSGCWKFAWLVRLSTAGAATESGAIMSVVSSAHPGSERDLPAPTSPRTSVPVRFWAVIGCLMWTFQSYVLLKWVSGPFFRPVDPGPVDPPPR